MPAVGAGWSDAQIEALVAYTKTLRNGSAIVATLSRSPFRADWPRPGHAWLTTDHKRIGILYISTTLAFFALGGIMALLMRTQLATPDEYVHHRTPTTSSSRCTGRR